MSVDSKSSSWASIFDELTAAESSLDACFTIFEEAVNENKPSSADFKSENWRQLHASLSRNGKQLDKVMLLSFSINRRLGISRI
mgnify:CR=1 FL=1